MTKNKLFIILGSSLKMIINDDDILHSKIYALDANDIIDGIIFNITKIENLITQFIDRYNLSNIAATIVLEDNLVVQSINQQLDLDPKIYHLKSYELQFYPIPIFYNLAVKHYQLFQYFLLCAQLSITIQSVITPVLHMHKLYKERSHKKIEKILTINSLKTFFKKSIEEANRQSICHSTKYFDTILKEYYF